MDAITHATETATGGEVRRRPYLGRYVPPPPRERPAAQSVTVSINLLADAIRMARENAHCHMKEGDGERASFAFFRAHEYAERIRKLRALLKESAP